MKNIFLAIFLLVSAVAFAQPVSNTITSDGSVVTVATPVNSKSIPVCSFNWIIVDGYLRIWITGSNEQVPGGRLKFFTINGVTDNSLKAGALGAITDECSAGGSGGGLDSLYYGTSLLANGDTIAVSGNTIYTASDSVANNDQQVKIKDDSTFSISYGLPYEQFWNDYANSTRFSGMFNSEGYWGANGFALLEKNGDSLTIESYINIKSDGEVYISSKKSGTNKQASFALSENGPSFSGSNPTYTYKLPSSSPSITNLAKSIITWTGDGSTTTPAFEAYLFGTTTNDNASAGYIGEYISSTLASGSALSFTTATARNIDTLVLAAGDWDVDANLIFGEGSATVTSRSAAITTTSATLPSNGTECPLDIPTTLTSGRNSISVKTTRISIASTTNVYLVGSATFSAGTVSGYGSFSARRVR